MLCQFTVKNFRCIKDELTLDMQATSISEHAHSLLRDAGNEDFLPLAVLYGPNGAGKSTVLLAVHSLARKVMLPIYAIMYPEHAYSGKESRLSYIKPFRFSKESMSQPTEYEIFFRTQQYEYQYRLHVLKGAVTFEELQRRQITGTRYSQIFLRDDRRKILLKASLSKYSVEGISQDIPLLSYLGITHKRNAIVKDAIGWFERRLRYIDYGNPLQEIQIGLFREEKLKRLLLDMFREMEIDVADYRAVKKKEYDESSGERFSIITKHKVNGEMHELELADESSGTIKLFGILPAVAISITQGQTLLIDELDAKMHPLLLKHIIKWYRDPTINTQRAQLIFTSHDLSTMDSENFRRDEIWFVAKGSDESCKLYSMVEFKCVDGGSNLGNEPYNVQYLEGRYGADPYLDRIVHWEEYHAGKSSEKEEATDRGVGSCPV